MSGLDIRVIPVYQEKIKSEFAGMTSKAIDSAINKYISPQVESKSPDMEWKKPVKSILKW